jgi:hypothetical protein
MVCTCIVLTCVGSYLFLCHLCVYDCLLNWIGLCLYSVYVVLSGVCIQQYFEYWIMGLDVCIVALLCVLCICVIFLCVEVFSIFLDFNDFPCILCSHIKHKSFIWEHNKSKTAVSLKERNFRHLMMAILGQNI